MKELLKVLGLTDDQIEIYLKILGKKALTIQEIQILLPRISLNNLFFIIRDLIQKNLIKEIVRESPRILKHYLAVPPFSIIKDTISQLKGTMANQEDSIEVQIGVFIEKIFKSEKNIEVESLGNEFQKIKDGIEKDVKSIKDEIEDLVSNVESGKISSGFLDKAEKELKNIINTELAGIVITLLKLKNEFIYESVGISEEQWKAVRDKIKDVLAASVHQKSQDINAIVSEEFREIQENLDKQLANKFESKIEQKSVYLGILNIFMNEIAKIEKLINTKRKFFKNDLRSFQEKSSKRVAEKFQEVIIDYKEKIIAAEDLLKSLADIYLKKGTFGIGKFWFIENKSRINEEITNILETSEDKTLIIVPRIDEYFPVDNLSLDLSEDLKKNGPSIKASSLTTKIRKSTDKIFVNEKVKKSLKEKFETLKKKSNKSKGFELTHYIAEILSVISEINSNSIVINNMKDWLNRLLIIRKMLDPNLKYKLLEDVDKWEKDYLIKKAQSEEIKPNELEKEESGITSKSVKPKAFTPMKGSLSPNLKVSIISSENHKNQISIAINRKENIEYRRIKSNKFIGFYADDSYLIIGYELDTKTDGQAKIACFGTNYKPLIDIFKPILLKKWNKEARPPKDIILIEGFIDILENINDLTGKKIGHILQDILDAAFKKGGITLDVLEIKLLMNKLKKIDEPLDEEGKRTVVDQIKEFNKILTKTELNIEIEFRSPLKEEKVEVFRESPQLKIQPATMAFGTNIDVDKLDGLFNLFIEKIDDLKGTQISEQIQNLINLVVQFSGASSILQWKHELSNVDRPLEDAFKEKLKEDFEEWRTSLINNASASPAIYQAAATDSSYSQPSAPIQDSELGDYTSPALGGTAETSPESQSKAQDVIETDNDLEYISENIDNLKGFEISRKLQDIMDTIIETQGFSSSLKDLKPWISKLRLIRAPLDDKMKGQFLTEFEKWQDKFSSKKDDLETLDYSPGFTISEQSETPAGGQGGGVVEIFEKVIVDASTLAGHQLTLSLQDASDILLVSHGALSIREIRQWISKLRSIREPLEDDVKNDLISILGKWKDKFK